MLQTSRLVFEGGFPAELFTSLIISMLATAGVLAIIWRADRESYLLYWSLGWVLYALRISELLWVGSFDPASPFAFVGMARDLCWTIGAARYAGGRGWWRVFAVIIAIEVAVRLSPLGALASVPLAMGAIRSLVACASFLSVAIVLWTASRPAAPARRLAACGMGAGAVTVALVPLVGAAATTAMGALLELAALAAALGLAFSELDNVTAMRLDALRRLEGTMKHVLRGHTNVCSRCSRIEGPAGWARPEEFVLTHTNAPVSHGICERCAERVFGLTIPDVDKGAA